MARCMGYMGGPQQEPGEGSRRRRSLGPACIPAPRRQMVMFGKKNERAARGAAAREAADSLLSLPVAALAAEIMPAFGPDGVSTKYGQRIGALQVANWLLKQYPRGTGQLKELLNPVREALQALEHAELILRRPLGGGRRGFRVAGNAAG